VGATGDSGPGVGVFVTKDGNDITIHYESGVTTVAQVESFLAGLVSPGVGSGSGLGFLEVKTPGTAGNVLTAPGHNIPLTNLAGGVSCEGHQTDGLLMDEAILYLKVTAWDAIDGLILDVQRSPSAAPGGLWGHVEPQALIGSAVGKFLEIDGNGDVFIKAATLPVNKVLAIPLRLPGAKRARFGLRAHDGANRAAFTATVAVEFVQTGITA
jgi:hypothetical protein